MKILRSIERRPALVIFVLALVLRLAWISTVENRLAWPDEQEFAAVASHIVAGDGYVSSSYRANPVVPAYLSVFMYAFGENYVPPRIGQSVIGALTCVVLYQLGGLVAGPAVGLLAGLMLAAYPAHIYLAGVFYVTSIATFLCMLSVYLTVLTARSRRPLGWATLAGLALGLTVLTRATFLAYVPCACLAILYADPQRWRRLLPATAVLVLVVTVTVAPWCVRNSRVFGQPMLVSSGLWETLWKGNNVLADGGPDDRNMAWATPLWESRLDRLSLVERAAVVAEYDVISAKVQQHYQSTHDIFLSRDAVLRPVVIAYVTEHPGRAVELFFRKIGTLFQAFSDTEKSNADTAPGKKRLAAITFYPVLALAALGALLAAPRHRRFAALYLLVASYVALYGMLTACTRFRLPLDPFLMLFAAVGLERIVGRVLGRSRLVAGLAHPSSV
jgi:4-amino-4-deoxy-L-arabinose transferase-like glycosyltransferase